MTSLVVAVCMACDDGAAADADMDAAADAELDAVDDVDARVEDAAQDQAWPTDVPVLADAVVDASRDGATPDAAVDVALDGPADASVPPDALVDGPPPDIPDTLPDIPEPAPDASLGCAPNLAPPWSRRLPLAGGSVVFNELQVDPAGDGDLEWLELHNQMAVDIDLSGWTLEDSVGFTFADSTLIPGGGYLVVAAAPARLDDLHGVTALGPYDGRLSRRGGQIDLRSNGGRLMDTVEYDDAVPWPTVPDDSGLSLAKADPDLASAPAESWRLSAQVGGTPGAQNFARANEPPETLVALDASWRYEASGADLGDLWRAPDFDDDGWAQGPAAFFTGAAEPAQVTARITADNFFALYIAGPEGEGLRLVGRDAVGDWTSAEDFDFEVRPEERVYLAAWEAPGNNGGPQMLIGQVGSAGQLLGTNAADFESVLGPDGASPLGGLGPPAPPVEEVLAVVENANADDAWAPPRADAHKGSPPWGAAVSHAFDVAARYIWPDTFAGASLTNIHNTYALFRSTRSPAPRPGDTELAAGPVTTYFRTVFDFDGDPEDSILTLAAISDDGAVLYLNGVEIHRQGMPEGALDAHTLALAPEGTREIRGLVISSDALLVGANVLAAEVHQAAPGDDRMRFAAALHAAPRPPEPEPPPEQGVAAEVVVNEIMYHPAAPLDPDAPAPPEWIELYNRGDAPVDVGGWQVVDAVAVQIPAGTVIEADGYLVLDDFDGRLANGGERIAVLDACGVLVDEVRYSSGGRWPAWADGDGASLELRNPRADNAVAEAWDASDEAAGSAWQVVRYRAEARPSAVGPDGQWEELVLGLLNAGEVWLDDVSVVEDPDGAAIELVQDGSFDAGEAAGWRIIGNHRHSEVVVDPDDPENGVLRLVASGATEHMHNHAETTLAGPVRNGVVYEIAYRARWIGGSDQLNSRLYFNRLARTVRLGRPELGGTPGARNSTFRENIGPTYTAFGHRPAVPAPGVPIPVSVVASDPDGVAEVRLWWTTGGVVYEPTAMVPEGRGLFTATLDGLDPGTLVHFYVEGTDALGAASTFPAGGIDARALLRVDDGLATSDGLHNLRILMTDADAERFHADINLMSNEHVGVTVVYDEREVFYDVGVRAKGSERGRPPQPRLGFNLRFHPDRRLRGVYETVSIDRSEGVRFGQREMLINQVMTRAGSVSGEFNDLTHLMAPRAAHTGSAEMQLARFGDLLLDNQFEDGADGALYEYELIYFPRTTDDGTPEGRKRPQPDGVVGTALRDLGDDVEAYRYNYLVKNNRRRDDPAALVAFLQVFTRPDPEFRAEVGSVIDVDQWLRAFAFGTLAGAVDNLAAGSAHNAQFYVRPTDQRVLYFPHDLDFYPGGANRALVGHGDLRRLFGVPGARRRYYGHLHDILETAYNDAYMAHWRDHFGALLPGQDFAAHHQFMVARARFVRSEAADSIEAEFPRVDFEITTNDGADFEVDADTVTLDGTGWIDAFTIRLAGDEDALEIDWPAGTTWRTTLPLAPGDNLLELEALDRSGRRVGLAAITVRRLAP